LQQVNYNVIYLHLQLLGS